MDNKTQLTVVISTEDHDALRALAASRERTISGEVRLAVAEHLDANATFLVVPGQTEIEA